MATSPPPNPTPTSYPPSLFSQRSRRCHSVYGRIYQTISLQTESSHQSVKYLFLPPPPQLLPSSPHRLPSYSLHQLLHLSAVAAADFELCVCACACTLVDVCACVCWYACARLHCCWSPAVGAVNHFCPEMRSGCSRGHTATICPSADMRWRVCMYECVCVQGLAVG